MLWLWQQKKGRLTLEFICRIDTKIKAYEFDASKIFLILKGSNSLSCHCNFGQSHFCHWGLHVSDIGEPNMLLRCQWQIMNHKIVKRKQCEELFLLKEPSSVYSREYFFSLYPFWYQSTYPLTWFADVELILKLGISVLRFDHLSKMTWKLNWCHPQPSKRTMISDLYSY
jgi:hypothetical protein